MTIDCSYVADGGVRSNGLQRPLHPLQIASWIALAVCIIIYSTLVLPFAPTRVELIIFIAVYFGLFVLGLPPYIALSFGDPRLKSKHRLAPLRPNQQPLPPSSHSIPINTQQHAHTHTALAGEVDGVSYCPLCAVRQGPNTKHCYLCHKCIDGFDHHCLYLNTCVGKRNYRYFFALISIVLALLLVQIFAAIWLIAHYNAAITQNTADESALNGVIAWTVLLAVLTVIPIVAFCLLLSLYGFHCYILFTGQTTYRFLLQRREIEARKRETIELAERVAHDAAMSKERAQIEANWLDQRRREAAERERGDAASSALSPTPLSAEQAHLKPADVTSVDNVRPEIKDTDDPPSQTHGDVVIRTLANVGGTLSAVRNSHLIRDESNQQDDARQENTEIKQS